MSLPSQTARTSPAGRSFVYKGRRKKRRPPPLVFAAGGAGLLVLALILYLVFGPGFGGPASANAAGDNGPGGTGLGSTGHAETRQRGGSEPVALNTAPTEPLPSAGRRDGLSPVRAKPVVTDPAERATESGGESGGAVRQAGSSPTPPPMAPERGMLAEAVHGEEDRAGGAQNGTPVRRAEPRGPSNSGKIAMHLDAADQLMLTNDPLAARQALWDAMRIPGLDELEARVLRDRLGALNEELVFSGPHRPGDPITMSYTVRPGDALSRIARTQDLGTHWKLIQRVNGLSSPNHIRAGQTVKLVRGPFHAVVDKSDFRLDLYHGPADAPGEWVYVRSFGVGLGEGDSTPIGMFVVRPDSKLENPGWVNPRNPAEKFAPDDPENPIGEYWVGLDGLGDAAVYTGYGIHGTVDPGSIGAERSMGCVRLAADDVALIYELLGEGESLVRIQR